MNENKRIRIRWLFILLFPFLFGQFLFVLFVEEPYPAFVLPLFGTIHGEDGVYSYNRERIEVVCAGGDRLEVSKGTLFRDLPEPHHIYALYRFFDVYGDSVYREDVDFRRWFWSQVEELELCDSVRGVEVIWRRVAYDTKEAVVARSEEGLGSVWYLREQGGKGGN